MNYENEYITAEVAKLTYGLRFADLMAYADNGEIRRSAFDSGDGRTTYLFRRGDIITLQLKSINVK